MRRVFSVILPTLQRSSALGALLELYCAHPLVAEVVLINNAPDALTVHHPKVRVLNQESNLFVNPSWNLGAREAQCQYLIISNDDIAFSPRVIDAAARALRLPIGIIGPDPSAFTRFDSPPRFSPAYRRTWGFGTLMFMRTRRYTPIPEGLRIWYGDDYLFNHQTHRNLYIRGARIETCMSTTSGDSSFDSIKHRDQELFIAHYQDGGYATTFAAEARFWRRAGQAKTGLALLCGRHGRIHPPRGI